MSPSRRRTSTAPLLTAVVLAVIVLLGLLAFVAGGGGGEPAAAATVSGDPLPEYTQGGEDPAVGMQAPVITGTSLDGDDLVYDPGQDGPAVIVFLAHWCPACNAEAPVIQSLADEGLFDNDVTLMTVTTGIDPDRPNHPPSEWFENFGWTPSVMVDGDNSVAEAYGLTAYPYWVFVDDSGEVVGRITGQLDESSIRAVTDQLSP